MLESFNALVMYVVSRLPGHCSLRMHDGHPDGLCDCVAHSSSGAVQRGRLTDVLRDVVRDTSRTTRLACPRVFLMKDWDELTVVVEFCL